MKELVTIDELVLHDDGVYSTRAVADITGFRASRLYPLLAQQSDRSSTNQDLLDLAEDVEEEFQLSPLRANLLRPFDWAPQSRVLEIGAGAGATTRFLAEQGLFVDALEPDRAQAQLAALRTQGFDDVRVISDAFSSVQFTPGKYDAVILVGVTDTAIEWVGQQGSGAEQAVIELINACRYLLSEQGQIFLVADNRQGVKYLFGAADERTKKRYYGFHGYTGDDTSRAWNLSEWNNLLARAQITEVDPYYLYPDYRFTRVLLGHDYAVKSPFAYQHLDGLHSRDYYQFTSFDFKESLLHEASLSNQCAGVFANSFLFVIGKHDKSVIQKIDFSHLPDFQRKPEFVTLVRKSRDQDIVKRLQVFYSHAGIEGEEAFIPGEQLSVQWHRQLISDPEMVDFEQSLLEYFEYLKQLESGVYEGFNIDALPINIIVDDSGEYHLFDLEWQTWPGVIDAEFVFYRALVVFALKNADAIRMINRNMVILGDFIMHCFKAVGLNPSTQGLESLRLRDHEFQDCIVQHSRGYQLTDPLGSVLDVGEILACVAWRFQGENYNPDQQVIKQASANNKYQKLIFKLPAMERVVECLRFLPYQLKGDQAAGYFGMESVSMHVVDNSGKRRMLFTLESGEEIARANIHDKVFFAQNNGEHMFMFTSADAFVEIEIPAYTLCGSEKPVIEVSYRVARSHDYELARHQYASIKREMEEKFKIIEHDKKSLAAQIEELNKIRNSRAWRLVQAWRDTFRISGYPEKSVFGKFSHLARRFRRSGPDG